jgi:VWFA-related protein
MRFGRNVIFIALVALTSFLPGGSAATSMQIQSGTQVLQPGPPGTYRVHVRLIPVDVIVTDQHDKPVLGLKREDFQVLENGHPQDIRHFSVQNLSQGVSRTDPIAAAKTTAVPDLPLPPARTFLILMGRGRHQTPLKAVDALIRFVRQDLLPQDRVAVFAYNRATDFITDHERIAQVLERYKKSNEEIESWLESRLQGLAAVYGIKDVPKSFQKEIDKIFDSGGMLASRQVPPGRMTEKGKIVKDWDAAADLLLRDSDRAVEADLRTQVAQDIADEGGAGSQVMLSLIRFDTMGKDFITLSLGFDGFAPQAAGSFQDLQNLYNCIEYLRYMDGDKHLILFSGEGLLFPNGNTTYDNGIIAMANDARVSIEAFQTAGTFADPEIVPTKGVILPTVQKGSSTPAAPPPQALSATNWSKSFMLAAFSNVAESTGGRASVGQDVGKSLNRLDETTRIVYQLGYYPDDDRLDGKFRQISVRVNRPGVKVSCRHGYYARDTLRPFNREEFLAYSRIAAAGGYESEIADLPIQVTAAKTKDDIGRPQIKVDLQVDPEKVGFKMVNDRHVSRLYITVFYADGDGNHLGDSWQTMNMELPEESYQRTLKAGIQYSTLIPQKTPSAILKVIIYDASGDKVGSKLVKVR